MASLFSQSLSLLLFLAGAALMFAEALAPGAHFFVLGVALLTAGLVGLLVPVSGVAGIVILAGAVLLVTGLTLYGYRRLDIYGGEGAARTLDSDSLRGKFGRVTEQVTTTEGEIKIDDGGFNPYYRARSLDGTIPEGEEVIVVDGGGGNVVTVERVAALDDEIDRELARDRASENADPDEREHDAGSVDPDERERDAESAE
ncbi:MAG: NfeD family protein [Haloarculaceae archaeon]